tara:strand:+ start:3974 stop:4474 length:501 start_codon:yes stop_codon:yes gene_type:complete
MFDVSQSKNSIQKRLNSDYQKLNYNQFRWWRWYESKNKPLPYKSDFRDKILNGDYDTSPYLLQSQLCEHMLNELLEECDSDYQKYLEKGKLLIARRKRLLEDYEKDEFNKLEEIYSQFQKNFDITRKQIEEEALKCCGELIDLYYIIKDNYIQKQYINKRGRPRKL